jgi:hypothetical protein
MRLPGQDMTMIAAQQYRANGNGHFAISEVEDDDAEQVRACSFLFLFLPISSIISTTARRALFVYVPMHVVLAYAVNVCTRLHASS